MGCSTILSTLSWGLGYFGVPQVLLRFMAIRKTAELKKSRRIATVWCVISLSGRGAHRLDGPGPVSHRACLPPPRCGKHLYRALRHLLPPLLAGLVMAGILAATISSSDSYLLIAASAVSMNIFQGILRRRTPRTNR